MERLDVGLIVEVVGVSLVAAGLAMVFVPLALVTVGAYLLWIVEKAN